MTIDGLEQTLGLACLTQPKTYLMIKKKHSQKYLKLIVLSKMALKSQNKIFENRDSTEPNDYLSIYKSSKYTMMNVGTNPTILYNEKSGKQ